MAEGDINWDEGVYFDTRAEAPAVFHYRIQCEAGRSIPAEFVKHTFAVSDRGRRRPCPECDTVPTPAWTP